MEEKEENKTNDSQQSLTQNKEEVFEQEDLSSDFFLENLVNSASFGMSMGITLSVGGILVSGMLINGKQYFELFGEMFGGGLGLEVGKVYEDQIKGLGATYDNLPDDDKPVYIHLKNAKFITQQATLFLPILYYGVVNLIELMGFS